ncbi:hypothetical protein ACNKHO_05520 [Shigella flexneri]
MKTETPDALLAAEVSRRGFMKTTAIGDWRWPAARSTLPFSRIPSALLMRSPQRRLRNGITWSACTVNCGSRCPRPPCLVHGEIKYVETDKTGDDDYEGLHQVRACSARPFNVLSVSTTEQTV